MYTAQYLWSAIGNSKLNCHVYIHTNSTSQIQHTLDFRFTLHVASGTQYAIFHPASWYLQLSENWPCPRTNEIKISAKYSQSLCFVSQCHLHYCYQLITVLVKTNTMYTSHLHFCCIFQLFLVQNTKQYVKEASRNISGCDMCHDKACITQHNKQVELLKSLHRGASVTIL